MPINNIGKLFYSLFIDAPLGVKLYSAITRKGKVLTLEFFIIWMIFAGICSGIAKHKNLNQGLWTLLGLFFGIFAVIAILFVKSNRPENTISSNAYLPNSTSSENHNNDVERLSNLKSLKDQGLITQEDYDEQKSKILNFNGPTGSNYGNTTLGAAGGAVGLGAASKNSAKNFIQNQASENSNNEDLTEDFTDFL